MRSCRLFILKHLQVHQDALEPTGEFLSEKWKINRFLMIKEVPDVVVSEYCPSENSKMNPKPANKKFEPRKGFEQRRFVLRVSHVWTYQPIYPAPVPYFAFSFLLHSIYLSILPRSSMLLSLRKNSIIPASGIPSRACPRGTHPAFHVSTVHPQRSHHFSFFR